MDREDIKYRFEQGKQKLTDGARKVKNGVCDFCVQNPRLAAVLGTVVVSCGTALVKEGWKDHRIRKEEDRRDSRVYDRRVDQYFETRRPLTNKEKAKLAERYGRGESKYEILKDMHLLK